MSQLAVKQTKSFLKATATAATAIFVPIRPFKALKAVITQLKYIAPVTTQHVLTIMRVHGIAATTVAQVAADVTVTLNQDPGAVSTIQHYGKYPDNVPGALAANDYIGIELDNGDLHFTKVTSLAGLVVTITTAIPTGRTVAIGAKVWQFGTVADNIANLLWPDIAGSGLAKTTYSDAVAGVFTADRKGDPLCVTSDNGTTAGHIELVSVAYIEAGSIA